MANVMKKSNILKLISIIKNNRQITKQDISALSGFNSVTVHICVNELVEKNIILEEGNADSNGGRRAVLYKFNPNLFNIIGISIGVKKIVASMFDMDLNILESISNECKFDMLTVDEGIHIILEMIYSLINNLQIDKEIIFGIGISVPGTVHYSKGLIYNFPNVPKWRNVPLRDIIENEIKLPVFIDRDNNVALLSLKWNNLLKNTDNAVYLSTTEGIGTGVLINGEIFRGNQSVAGEFGHITIEIDGPKCKCGNFGCIELYASDMAINNFLRNEMEIRKQGVLYNLCSGDLNRVTIPLAIQAAKNGDNYIKEIFQNAGKYLSICISNVLKICAPTKLILESTWLGEFNDIYYSILNSVFENSNFFERNDVNITLNTFKDCYLIGSATIVLDNLFTKFEGNKLLKHIVK